MKWSWYHVYVLLDAFSRYVVGWLVADREAAWLAEELIATSCARQGIRRDQLTIHADRGTAMTSRSVALLFADLGITPSHSRPSVANDNPYSEAHFKTIKYRPDFPDRFGALADARAYCADLFPVVQHRAPALGARLSHASRCALRPRRRTADPARCGAAGRVRPAPRTLRPSDSHAAAAFHRGVDKPTQTPHAVRGRCSVNSSHPVSHFC